MTIITNFNLDRPRVLFSLYYLTFGKYLNLSEKLDSMHPMKRGEIKPYMELQNKLKEYSDTLRDLDEKIHEYIVKNQ